MDFNQLRSWLDLPPGPWPPDHYTLLGLLPGSRDAGQIEPRVLQQMDRLRSHQLLHPELVTEGMNRLAQALITLTDPASKASYDRELGIEPPRARDDSRGTTAASSRSPEPPSEASVIVAAPVFDDDIFSDDASLPEQPDAIEETRVIEWRPDLPVPKGDTGTATYEPLAEEPRTAPPSAYEVLPEPWVEPLTLEQERQAPGAGAMPPGLDAATLATATSWVVARRRLYARLALLRKARRAWDALGPFMGNPDEPVDRPIRILTLLEAVAVVRPLLDDLRGAVGDVEGPGGAVAAVVRHPLVLDTFRRLLPTQRTALAIDWKQGQERLADQYVRLRQSLQEERERRAGARSGLAFARWLAESPEVVLILLAGIVLFAGLLRAATGR